MSNFELAEMQTRIAQIIERSRYHEEMILVDSKTAARNIIQYLQNENFMENPQDEAN